MTNESNTIDAMAALEATITTLRQVLSLKNSHIAMLEERLFEMSVELASLRAREDEQNLKPRQSTQEPQDSTSTITMSEEDDFMIPVNLVDDGIRRALSSSSNRHPLFSVMQGWGSSHKPDDDFFYGTISLSSGAGSIIGNIVKFDRSEDLRVNFPSGGRRSMTMDEYSAATDNSTAHRRRTLLIGHLFRPRISSLTIDDSTEEICEQERTLHQIPNPKVLRHQVSSRLLGSTVLFPREDDDYSLGFE